MPDVRRASRRLLPWLATLSLATSGCAVLLPAPRTTTWTAPAPRRAFEPAHISAFFEPLSNHGRWHRAGHGWHWRPSERGFAPFTEGHWTLTEYGPTWVSATAWGWAVEHYGRWHHDHEGWVWEPDTTWHAANVHWRRGSRVIGWSPRMTGTSAADPASAWRFSPNDAFFRTLADTRAGQVPLEDPRYSAFHLAHSRSLAAWRRTAEGHVVAVVAAPRPLTSLDAASTRWQPAWARENVAGSLLPFPRGTRSRPAESPRRRRAPPVPAAPEGDAEKDLSP